MKLLRERKAHIKNIITLTEELPDSYCFGCNDVTTDVG
jgi:hypothetical protein